MVKIPVMFVVEIGSVITTIEFLARPDLFVGLVTAWLWATGLFANFAEAVAEGRGKAQADALRRSRKETTARRLRPDGTTEIIPSTQLRVGDPCVVEAGEVIPGDGDAVEGRGPLSSRVFAGEMADGSYFPRLHAEDPGIAGREARALRAEHWPVLWFTSHGE